MGTDRPHAFKISAYYNSRWKAFNPTIGLFESIYSGTPMSSYISVFQDFHVSKSNERLIARVGLDCLNCFNQHAPAVLHGYNYLGLANSQSRILNSTHGSPQFWQLPRSVRFQVRFTF